MLSALNAIYFSDMMTIVFEFVPQVIFLAGLFGFFVLKFVFLYF